MASLKLKFDIVEHPEEAIYVEEELRSHSAKQRAGPSAWLKSWLKSLAGARGGSWTITERVAFETHAATILCDCLQSDGKTLPFEEAAKLIVASLPANQARYQYCAFAIAGLCLEAAEQIPYSHPSLRKLAFLCRYLCHTPDFMETRSSGEILRHFFQALKETMRDNFEGPHTDEDPMCWVSYHAFLSHLESLGVFYGDPIYAIWAVRDAWETEPRKGERECVIMAAAQWILWYGQPLFLDMLHPSTWRHPDPDDKSLHVGDLYEVARPDGESTDELGLDRWHFWKQGFADVGAGRISYDDSGTLGDECRALSSKAASLMDAYEKQLSF